MYIDWAKDLVVLMGLVAGAGFYALVYAGLEKVFPFLRGGFARLK